MAGRLNTPGSLAKFGLSADRAGVKLTGNGNTRDTLSKAMEIGDTTGMEMTKALVPQNA
jgi:hypothetical protein